MIVASLERFFLLGPAPGESLQGHHDLALVLLSIAVAIGTATLGMHLAQLAHRRPEKLRHHATLASGAIAVGMGIWAMHFIGMLAFHLPIQVSYDLPMTLLTLLPVLAAAWWSMRLMGRSQVGRAQLLAGGMVLAAGIALMHYGGMAALQLQAAVRYEPLAFTASIAVAALLATLALWLRFSLPQRGFSGRQATVLAGVALGLTTACMHYLGMSSTHFIGPAQLDLPDTGWREPLALAIALTTAAVASLVIAFNGLLHYRDLYRQVHHSETRLRAMLDTAVDAIVTIDARGTVQSFNPSAERIFGWSALEACGRNVSTLMPEPFSSAHDGYLERYMRTGDAHIIGTGREVVGLHKDGSTVPLRLAVGRAGSRRHPVFVGFLTDLTALKQAQDQLRIAASVFHHSYEATLILDSEQRVVDLNPSFERMMGLDRLACMQRSVEQFYAGVDFSPMWQAVAARGHWTGELSTRGAAQQLLTQRVSIAAVQDGDQRPRHFIVVISDITQAKAYEQELERIALYDSLTGLPNRRLLIDRLRQGLAQAQRAGTLLAVCYLDLDGFKAVNDQHGHEAGDHLLIEVGRRIQAQLRAQDTLARLGGDEMVVLIDDLVDAGDCLPVLQRILQAIHQPVSLASGTAQVSASMGLALYPLDGEAPHQLLRHADQAMYEAKQAGKNQCRRFQSATAQAPRPEKQPSV